jgi:nucleoside 2-deoxyribosyltransferase
MDHLKSSNRQPATVRSTMVYLAGPFFSMGQRWVIDEALHALQDFRVPVFSPVHEVGPGPAEIVGPADLKGLAGCDSVLAIVDGLDAGTIFEIGYARAQGKPVYALAQTVASEDLKMLQGSGCRVFDDFVTAVHHAVWRT